MKKISLFFLILISSIQLHSQKVHILSGINYFYLSGDIYSSTDTFSNNFNSSGDYGFQVGYNIEFLIKKNISLLLGQEFSQKNFKNAHIEEESIKESRFLYLSTPILLNYKITPKTTLNTGFLFDYLLHKQKLTYFDPDTLEPGLLNYDFAFNMGFRQRFKGIEVYLEWTIGLLDIISLESENPNLYKENSKSRMLKLGLAYQIE